jgi:uncharacterized protein YcaQ
MTIETLRRHVLAAQGFAQRSKRATVSDVLACVRRLSCVQLDSIATVERSHRLVLASRVGTAPLHAASELLGSGQLFEYWAHEASLVPVEDWPLFRHRMDERSIHHWWGPVIASDPELARSVMDEVRERGPLRSSSFEGRNRGMWGLKPAKRMLDALWTAGQLVVRGRVAFQRLYDLPERVIPAAQLEAPPLSRERAVRALIVKAVAARGALTERGIANHYRLGAVRDFRPQLEELVSTGLLRRAEVEDGGPPVYLEAGARPEDAPRSTKSVLLSPFDNLLWDRDFAERVLGFRHIIEVYKREPERVYGYYAMPWLRGETFAGRVDLKADRPSGVLSVRGLYLEPGQRKGKGLDADFQRALSRLATAIGLSASRPIPGEH